MKTLDLLICISSFHEFLFCQNRAFFRKSAQEFILAVEGFVSFGLGFCVSRSLPNEKTAKEEDKREFSERKKNLENAYFCHKL